MSVVVLGKGFLGSEICQALQARGYEVDSYDSKSCNMLDCQTLGDCLGRYRELRGLIVTACITRTRANDRRAFTANVSMIENLLTVLEARALKIEHLVYLSTIDVYGLVDGRLPITEETALAPDDYYSLSKVVGEFMFRRFAAEAGCPLLILRLPGIYGEGDAGRSTLFQMVSSAIEKRVINIENGGSTLRDFVFAGDLCRLIAQALRDPVHGVFNVATAKSSSILEIAKLIQQNLPFEVKLQIISKTQNVLRAGDLRFDTTQLQRSFPEIRMTPLSEGLSEYVRSFSGEKK